MIALFQSRLLLGQEARRFLRERANLFILGASLLLLCASATWSGLAADQARVGAARQQAQWSQRLAERIMHARSAAPPTGAAAARQVFDFARDDPPPTLPPASGALVLAVQQAVAPVRITIESRYTDGRRSEALDNPLLRNAGTLDFAAVVALLLPLTLIALCYGLVQDARERGIWALVCAQSRAPWRVLAAALGVRLLAALAIAALASALAFGLDRGATVPAFAGWMGAVAMFALVWTLACALANVLRVQAAAAGMALLGLWLLTSFALPPLLQRVAEAHTPMPSRLEAVVQLRAIQQDAEVRMGELLQAWYAQRPALAALAPGPHAWPVSFIPRLLEQDRGMRALMLRYTEANARRALDVEDWSAFAPGLALSLRADRLARQDPASHAHYIAAINRFEDAWRAFLVPRLMAYRALGAQDFASLPAFVLPPPRSALPSPLPAGQLLLALALATLFGAFSGALKRP